MAAQMITLKLAHPLTAGQAARLRAKEVKEYERPGMEITVPAEEARAIIDAGYASGIEPMDQDAVRDALNPDKPDTTPPVDPPAEPAPARTPTSKSAKTSGLDASSS